MRGHGMLGHGRAARFPGNTIGGRRSRGFAAAVLVMAAGAVSLLATACASLANTPAQNVAWTRWSLCHAEVGTTEIRTVQLDGRILFWYSGPGDKQAMLDCLRRAATAGPALPEPIGESLPRGV